MSNETQIERGANDDRSDLRIAVRRSAPGIFVLVFAMGAALGSLPAEFTHYKRWLELGSEETALRLAVLVAILSRTLLVLTVALGLATILTRRREPRTRRVAGIFATGLVLVLLGADLELQRRTGNNLVRYLPFLLDPETFLWAGQGFDAGPSLLRLGGHIGMVCLPAAALAWAAEAWVARGDRRVRVVAIGLLTFASIILVGAPLAGRSSGDPIRLYHLGERMPGAWTTGLGTRFDRFAQQQHEAEQLFERAAPRRSAPRRLDDLLAGTTPSRRPDVLLVVVESLRHDALDPVTMPRVWMESEKGLRLETHYATSNASHYGLFALLYGRSPLLYFETLDSGEPPTLPDRLREWGYTTHHLTCSDIHWRGMDRFMGADDFSAERMKDATLEECDRRVVDRAIEVLGPGERPPRFVLAFMMSTHFGYHFPDDAEHFRPSAPPPNALDPVADRDIESLHNRYRNSAHHVDSMIGRLLDAIDLENTLVVVTGDHGESLFDDGTIAHSSLLSEIQTRVPLAMFGEGVSASMEASGPTDHADVVPTLLARMGVDRDRIAALPGRDVAEEAASPFVALVHAKARPGGEDRIALVGADARYAFKLDANPARILFLGELRKDGRPSRERQGRSRGDQPVRWLEAYLKSMTER